MRCVQPCRRKLDFSEPEILATRLETDEKAFAFRVADIGIRHAAVDTSTRTRVDLLAAAAAYPDQWQSIPDLGPCM